MSFFNGVEYLSVAIFLAYIILCLGVAYLNKRRGNRFGTGFVLSLILTPVIGVMIVLFTRDRNRNFKYHTSHGRRRKKRRKLLY